VSNCISAVSEKDIQKSSQLIERLKGPRTTHVTSERLNVSESRSTLPILWANIQFLKLDSKNFGLSTADFRVTVNDRTVMVE
jgi:hypothetical protein